MMAVCMNNELIITKRLLLRHFNELDAADLYNILSDEEVTKFLPMFPLQNEAEAKEYIKKRFLDHYAKGDCWHYAICLKDGELVGFINIAQDDSHDLGYCIKKSSWHQGVASEAALAVVECFKACGGDYITATHDINNLNSGKVMKKIGMHYCYSYEEQWQPKDFKVTFRLWQLNFDGKQNVYQKYWQQSDCHYIETLEEIA